MCAANFLSSLYGYKKLLPKYKRVNIGFPKSLNAVWTSSRRTRDPSHPSQKKKRQYF